MSSILRRLFKADLKYFISPFMKGYLIKNLCILLLFLMIFIPLLKNMDNPIRQHDPSEEMFVYDQYPSVRDVDYDYYYDSHFSVEFKEEGPEKSINTEGEADGPLTLGSGLVVVLTLVVLLINLIIVHSMIYIKSLKSGYVRAVTRSGIATGDVLRSKMISVSLIFAVLSIFDVFIASIIGEMIAGWFWKIFIPGFSIVIVMVSLYSISFGILTLIKVPKKERMVLPLGVFFVISTGLLIITQNGSNILISTIDDMFGTGTTSGSGTPLMYLSPFHMLGEITDWAVYGTDISVWSFLWVPFALFSIYIGYRSLAKVEYHHIHSFPVQPVGIHEEYWRPHP